MQAMMPMQTKKAPAAGQILPKRKRAASRIWWRVIIVSFNLELLYKVMNLGPLAVE